MGEGAQAEEVGVAECRDLGDEVGHGPV